ncbi:protein kinase domain-containing protein [Desulfospira joergensenii]|uniref:protein kinase domain-containing protein n=1 Tax=Desulfospira joergensenii TaxID=53329 RepID=UPI0003B75FFF|nr:protein kinase [Desulfospira joergensenii]
MNVSTEMNLNQLGSTASNVTDNTRLILNDSGQVVKGKSYKGRLAAALLKAPETNRQIWDHLKTALGTKYNTRIVSKVLPESTDTSKPLTARTAKQILRNARDLQIFSEFNQSAKEMGKIIETEARLKDLPEFKQQLETLKQEHESVTKQFNEVQESMAKNQDTNLDILDVLVPKGARLSHEIKALEQKIEGLDREKRGLGDKSAIAMKQQILGIKSEMLNLAGAKAGTINREKVLQIGSTLAKMADQCLTEARSLHQANDLEGLQKLTNTYKKAFGELSSSFNDIKKNLVGSKMIKSPATHAFLTALGQRITRFNMPLIELGGKIKKGRDPLQDDADRQGALKKIPHAIDELAHQVKGTRVGGPGQVCVMLANLDDLANKQKEGSKRFTALKEIKDAVACHRFEQALEQMSDYNDRYKDANLGKQNANLVNLCMLQKANPEIFPDRTTDYHGSYERKGSKISIDGEDFTIKKTLGTGSKSESRIMLVKRDRDDQSFVVRIGPQILGKDGIGEESNRGAKLEMNAFQRIGQHKNIVGFERYGVDAADEKGLVMTEALSGKELKSVYNKIKAPLSDQDVLLVKKYIAREAYNGLKHIQDCRMASGDFDDTNLRITDDGEIKIFDFDMAKDINTDQKSKNFDVIRFVTMLQKSQFFAKDSALSRYQKIPEDVNEKRQTFPEFFSQPKYKDSFGPAINLGSKKLLEEAFQEKKAEFYTWLKDKDIQPIPSNFGDLLPRNPEDPGYPGLRDLLTLSDTEADNAKTLLGSLMKEE